MQLTQNNLKKILSLVELFNEEEELTEIDGGIKIVILQRGWVFIGRFKKIGSQCKLHNAYCIRRWGTSEGLGELAFKGKLNDTILEKTPPVKFHELTVIATIDCVEEKWKDLI